MTVERVRQLIAGGDSLAVAFTSEADRPLSERELVERCETFAGASRILT